MSLRVFNDLTNSSREMAWLLGNYGVFFSKFINSDLVNFEFFISLLELTYSDLTLSDLK